jgi:aspartyl/asparaginyl beta-hydroxylase (cupin superfamily)/Tfp pilus assembly protein PilF
MAQADQAITQLLQAAAEADARGDAPAVERLLSQAQSVAPNHPLIANERARRLLLVGNWGGAAQILQEALKDAPSQSSLWLNLAAALRGMNQPEQERVAIEQALALEPRNVRALLQKASLQEAAGAARAAAATYRVALQAIPPRAEPPPAMRPALQHAREVVEANNRSLENHLEQRLAALRGRHKDASLARFDQCLAILLQKQPIYRQQPTFLYFPHLPAIEFYERSEFPWLAGIEAATPQVRRELMAVMAQGPAALEPYVALPKGTPLDQWAQLNHSRKWGVYYLWHESKPMPEHIAACPQTVAALDAWPRCEIPGCSPTAVFSILDAKTRIPPHTGVTNTRLIVHLPLVVPPGCGFRVGGSRREWTEGECFVFDDTLEHEAWNDSDVPRAVLIFDIWSPYLTPMERDLVRAATEGVGEYYGKLSLGTA